MPDGGETDDPKAATSNPPVPSDAVSSLQRFGQDNINVQRAALEPRYDD